MPKPTDWSDIAQLLRRLRLMFGNVRVLSLDEEDAYLASKQYPELASSYVPAMLDEAGILTPRSEHWPDLVEFARDVLNSEAPHENLPEFIRNEMVDHVAEVDDAVEQRCLDLDFVRSWGVVNHAAGIYTSLILAQQTEEKKFEQGLRSGNKSLLQRYWDARWMVHAGVPDTVSRAEAERSSRRM